MKQFPNLIKIGNMQNIIIETIIANTITNKSPNYPINDQTPGYKKVLSTISR